MAREHEDNDVPYRSPVSIGVAEIASDEDEADVSTLAQVLQVIDDAKKKTSDMQSVDFNHKTLSGEQQIFAYQFALSEVIEPLEALIASTIGDVRLKQLKGDK